MQKLKICSILCCFFILAACSSNKKIPEGKRISVIDTPSKTDILKENKSLEISQPQNKKSWPQNRGNEKHLLGNIKVSDDIKEKWTASFENGASKRDLILCEPIIVNNTVYIQDVKGTLYAFDIKTGKRVFKQKLKPLNKSDLESGLNGVGLASDGTKIYALTGFGSVFALDAQTGDILWRKEVNAPLRTAPTLGDGKLFVQTIGNEILVLKTSDGSEIWQYGISAEDTILAGGAAPAYDKSTNNLIVAFSNGELTAFNAKIGYPVWSVSLINSSGLGISSYINAIKAAPVIDKNIVIAVGSNNMTAAIDIKTGDTLWQREISGTQTPLINNDVIYLISSDYNLLALDKNDGQTLWQTPLFENMKAKEKQSVYLNTPVMFNSKLFVTASNGNVFVFNASTGKLEKSFDLGENIPFAPIGADQTVIFTTNKANIIAFQ